MNTHHQLARLLFGLYALLILVTFQDYGITTDEHFHIKYGADIFQWYTSFFENDAVLKSRNTYFYGGLFDTFSHIVHRILPLGPYEASHLCNALLGLLGTVAAYRIGKALGGPTAGLLSALCLLLTPRYYGHAFNNPKDIPFAVFYLWSLDAIISGLGVLPHLSRRHIWHLGLSIGATLAMRMPAAVLVAYMGGFFVLRNLQILVQEENLTASKLWPAARILLRHMVAVLAIACTVMVLFWPWAQLNPIRHPLEAIRLFSRFPEPHPSFFEGHYVISTDLPRHYAAKWLLIALPEFVTLGLAGGLIAWIFTIRDRRRLNLQILLLLTGALFPLTVIVVGRTPLYDGLRHVLFTIPPLVVAAVLGLLYAHTRLRAAWMRNGWTALIILLTTLTAWDMVRLHPNQYVYFNRLFAGGLATAARSYETDYWQNSFRQGIRWIETRFPLRHSGPKYRIGCLYLEVAHSLDSDHYEVVQPPESADFYLGITRFDRHRVVPGETLHIVKADGVPLLYILRPDSTYKNDPTFTDSPFYHFRQGERHEQAGRLEAALKAYHKILDLNDDRARHYLSTDNVYSRIGFLYQKLGRYPEALENYRKALEINPRHSASYNNIGAIYIRQKNYSEALNWFQKAVDVQPNYAMGHINIGNIHLLYDNPKAALAAFNRALAIQADHPTAQEGRKQAVQLLETP